MTHDANGFAKKYYEFNDLWLDIAFPLYEDAAKQQKLFFCFTFRFFLTIWENLDSDEIQKLTLIASTFFNYSEAETTIHIKTLRSELPSFNLGETTKKLVPDYLVLLSDIHFKYEIDNSHTFTEGIEYMPEAFDYPPEFTFEILSSLGYDRV